MKLNDRNDIVMNQQEQNIMRGWVNGISPTIMDGLTALSSTTPTGYHGVSKEEFIESLGYDIQLRWVHVPYSMMEVVWDYIDSCYSISSSKLSRITEVKKEIRRLRELNKDVDYEHKHFLSGAGRPWGEDDAINMQDIFKDTFHRLNSMFNEALNEHYTFSTEDDRKYFWSCSYIAYIVCEAVIRYGRVFRRKFQKQFKIEIRDILCKEFYETAKVLETLVAKKPLTLKDTTCSQLIDNLVEGMFDIQFMVNETEALERKLI